MSCRIDHKKTIIHYEIDEQRIKYLHKNNKGFARLSKFNSRYMFALYMLKKYIHNLVEIKKIDRRRRRNGGTILLDDSLKRVDRGRVGVVVDIKKDDNTEVQSVNNNKQNNTISMKPIIISKRPKYEEIDDVHRDKDIDSGPQHQMGRLDSFDLKEPHTSGVDISYNSMVRRKYVEL